MKAVAFLACALAACTPAAATNLVTGNGFGFAVVTPQTAMLTRFYAHPYSFARSDPQKEMSEGIPTANFLKSLRLGSGGASAEYENDSHVIRVHGTAGEGYVWMPFGLGRAALIVDWEPNAPNGHDELRAEWTAPVKARHSLHSAGLPVTLLTFQGIDETLLLIPLTSESAAAPSGGLLRGSRAWALISLPDAREVHATVRAFAAWRAGLAPRELAQREVAGLERWRVRPAIAFASEAARHLWRQSETMLRMAQCREPNRADFYGNGLIVASLPDGAWAMPWVRDMAWATVALARMGHTHEAREAILGYFNARPTGLMRAAVAGADYQISVVRYFGNGAEEPFFTQEGSKNVEYDDWGEALWALGEYLRASDDYALLRQATFRGPLYASARDFVVKPLLANLETFGGGLIVRADTSIWEERQKDQKHFAFTTAMAIVGLEQFAAIATRTGDEASAKQARHVSQQLRTGFNAAFIRHGTLHGTLEEGLKNDVDGALLPIVHFGVVTDAAVVNDLVQRMELLKVDSGGYRRVRSTYTDPAIYEYWYERQEFLFVDLSMAEVLRGLGRRPEGDAIVQRIVTKAAADHNIIPEMYVSLDCALFHGAIGDPTGARPMVGYGAGAYILDVLDRAAQ